MINGDIKTFVDTLYYGTDISLKYNGKRLLIDGWYENDIYHLRMVDYDNPKDQTSIYNFEISNENNNKVVEEFLSKEIWNGKKFYDEAQNIEWTDEF